MTLTPTNGHQVVTSGAALQNDRRTDTNDVSSIAAFGSLLRQIQPPIQMRLGGADKTSVSQMFDAEPTASPDARRSGPDGARTGASELRNSYGRFDATSICDTDVLSAPPSRI